jgi:hypothetical protein
MMGVSAAPAVDIPGDLDAEEGDVLVGESPGEVRTIGCLRMAQHDPAPLPTKNRGKLTSTFPKIAIVGKVSAARYQAD